MKGATVAFALVIAAIVVGAGFFVTQQGPTNSTASQTTTIISSSGTASQSSQTSAAVDETIVIHVVNSTSGVSIPDEPMVAGPASSASDIVYTPDGESISECGHFVSNGATVSGGEAISNGTTTTYAPCPLVDYNTNSTGWLTITNQNASYFFIEVGSMIRSNAQVIALEGSLTYVTAPFPEGNFTVSSPGVSGSSGGLQLQLQVNFYHDVGTNGGLMVSMVVDERNALSTANNVTQANNWPLSGLGVAPCPTDLPYGVALYQGYYTAANVTQAQRLDIYPVVACPLLLRLVTSYLFQPSSDLATILPGTGNATQMLSKVNATGTYSGSIATNSSPTPLPPGAYTVAAGDEWGALVVQQFTISSDGTATLIG